jgi:hypothetical protein
MKVTCSPLCIPYIYICIVYIYSCISIDGQVRLVHLVCFQTDNFRLFLCQQTDKTTNFRSHHKPTVNALKRKSPWLLFYVFRLISPCPCLHVSMSMPTSPNKAALFPLITRHYAIWIENCYQQRKALLFQGL